MRCSRLNYPAVYKTNKINLEILQQELPLSNILKILLIILPYYIKYWLLVFMVFLLLLNKSLNKANIWQKNNFGDWFKLNMKFFLHVYPSTHTNILLCLLTQWNTQMLSLLWFRRLMSQKVPCPLSSMKTACLKNNTEMTKMTEFWIDYDTTLCWKK